MRKVVLLNDLDIADTISSSLYKEYVKLLEKDINSIFLKSSSTMVDVACPGCGADDNPVSYTKIGMNFKVCSKCASHYVSPRPTPQLLKEFYKDSKACRHWRKESLNLPESQLYYIYGPRVNWILELSDEFLNSTPALLDLETKYPHLLQHILSQDVFKTVLSFKPQLFERENLLPQAVKVSDDTDNYNGDVSIVTAFETLERMFCPADVFKLAYKCCQPSGLLLVTTATCSGFEYQILGHNAPNINPVNRMNLLSIEALQRSITDAGFEIIELSTPGRLDTEMVRQALKESQDMDIAGFWKYIFRFRDEHAWQGLQNFLQVNRLSSHVRIAARKKVGTT